MIDKSEYEKQDNETLDSLIRDPDWDCDQRWRAWCLLVDLHLLRKVGAELLRQPGIKDQMDYTSIYDKLNIAIGEDDAVES